MPPPPLLSTLQHHQRGSSWKRHFCASAVAATVVTSTFLLSAMVLSPWDEEGMTKKPKEVITGKKKLKQLASSMLIRPPGRWVPYNLKNPAKVQRNDLHTSQVGQDRMIDDLLRQMTGGFFIECGALDGERLSNTLFFEMARNWTGLLVEANPIEFNRLKKKYASKEQFNVARAVGHSGLADAPETDKNHWRAQQNTVQTVEVQCIPLGPVLSVLNISTVHFFSLDVEGAEIEILKALPWNKVDFWVMVIEVIHAHVGEGPHLIPNFMERRGYTLVGYTQFDGVFAKNEKIADGTLKVPELKEPKKGWALRYMRRKGLLLSKNKA